MLLLSWWKYNLWWIIVFVKNILITVDISKMDNVTNYIQNDVFVVIIAMNMLIATDIIIHVTNIIMRRYSTVVADLKFVAIIRSIIIIL